MNISQLDQDVYPIILSRLSPQNIVAFCSTNRYYRSICTEQFWKQIILARWGNLKNTLLPSREYQDRYAEDIRLLIYNAYSGNLSIVLSLINRGFTNLNKTNYYGETALYLASYCGHIEIIKQLVNAGADVDTRDQFGNSALYVACYEGSLRTVKELIKVGADINRLNDRFLNPLYAAAYTDDNRKLAIVRLLLERGVDQLDVQDSEGNTALLLACRNENIEIVQELIKAGANINHQNKFGCTALYMARNNSKIFDLLLANGADINLQDKAGETILHQIVKQDSSIELVKRLIKSNADVNLQNKDGRTALHVALFQRDGPRVCYLELIKAGTDINLEDNYGRTALYYIKKYNLIDVIQYI